MVVCLGDEFFTARNNSCGKVMFSQASVSHSIGGYPWSNVLSVGVSMSGGAGVCPRGWGLVFLGGVGMSKGRGGYPPPATNT